MLKQLSIYSLVILTAFSLKSLSAQTFIEDAEDVAADIGFFMQQFIAPGVEGTMYQTASGWYTSAKTLEKWEIMASMQGNFLLIPNNKKTFFATNSQFRNLTIRGAESANFQTAAGGTSNQYLDGNIGAQTFEIFAPSGIDASSVFHGQFHMAVGLPYGTQFMARITPKTKIKSSNIQAYGVGVMHNLTQWTPKIKDNGFDVSVLVALSQYVADDRFSPFEFGGESVSGITSKGNIFITGLVGSKQWGAFDASLAVLYSTSTPELTFEGEGTLLVPQLNRVLNTNEETQNNITADIGLNYNFNNFSVNSIVTLGDFTNLLLGVNYRFKF